MAQATWTPPQLVRLRENLTRYFTEGELRTLCFDLQKLCTDLQELDYESLDGAGKADKVRELVSYVERRECILALAKKCRELRPKVDWGITFETSQPLPTHHPPTSTFTPIPGRVTSADLANAAWTALGNKDYQQAVDLTQQCISLFENQAIQQQQALSAAPPNGVVSEADKKRIFANWALNDVATSYFIMGQAMEGLHRMNEAKDAYRGAVRFPYARTWDLRGWFWSPAETAAKRLTEI